MNAKSYSQKTVEYMLYGCIIIGILLSIIANNNMRNTNNHASRMSFIQTSAAGYMTSSIAILFITIFFILFNTNRVSQNNSLSQSFKDSFSRIILYPLPAILTTIVFLFASVQTLVFQNRLADNHVANEYFQWINSFSFLITIQTILLGYYAIFDAKKNSSYRYLIYLIATFNLIILGITQVILQFFSTDG